MVCKHDSNKLYDEFELLSDLLSIPFKVKCPIVLKKPVSDIVQSMAIYNFIGSSFNWQISRKAIHSQIKY